MSGKQYDGDYFLRGKQSGKSLYEDYRWLPNLTIPMVREIVNHCRIKRAFPVLDFGCARGYVVRALREIGIEAWGYDISQWALDNADPASHDYLIANESTLYADSFSWVIVKDVLEHVEDLSRTIDLIMSLALDGVFAVVPLSHDGKVYDVPEYELDVTHIHRRPLQWWVGHFHRPGWAVTGQYQVKGIKDNYAHFPTGNGFITARRI